ncbi:MAG: hypothetical protein R3232_10840, partial [Clostridia bacterium]|nr:hypothetical protein [Clostridia bacterium]
MRYSPLLTRYIFILLIVIGNSTAYSQTYQFRNYSDQEGLTGRYVYTINQDERAFIWLGTNNGLILFDGFDFHNVLLPDSTSKAFPVSSLNLPDGKIIYGMNDGSTYMANRGQIEGIEGVEAFRINDIIPGEENEV